MIADEETYFISICLQGFFYGLYSGIFAMYLQCPSNKPRTANIVFHALCLLYVLSTATVVSDLLSFILETRISTLSLQLQTDSQPMIIRLLIVQIVAGSCCDFIAQCIIIYRCWIVWGQSTLVVIIPSFLAITYLATCLAAAGATTQVQVQGLYFAAWEVPVAITSFSLSMIVNALVTGLIVFKILKVFLEVKAASTSVERTLGSTGGTTLRHIIFVLIESGMALFAIQLVRFVLSNLQMPSAPNALSLDLVIRINEMFNGISATIILLRVSMRLSFDDNESFVEAAGSLRFANPPSDPNSTVQRMGS